MGRRVKVKLQDTVPARVVFIDPNASEGATLGTNLFMADGTIGTPATVRAWLGVAEAPDPRQRSTSGGVVHHRLLQGLTLGDDHPQYTQWVQNEHITGAWVFENTLTVDISSDTFQWQATDTQIEQTVPLFLVRTDDILSQTPWEFLTFRDDSVANAPPVRMAHDDFGSLHMVSNADYAELGGNLFVRDNTALPAFMISLNQQFDEIVFHVAAAGVGTINWNAAGAALRMGTDGRLRITTAGSATAPAVAVGSAGTYGMWTSGSALRFSAAGVEQFNASNVGIDASPPFRANSGSAAAPAYTFWAASDTDTGMYRVAENQLGFSTGGVLRLTLSTTALTSTLPYVAPLGAVGAPSHTFVGDLNTGMWSPGPDLLAFSVAAAEVFRASAAGIELGHATDTTLSRNAAGDVAVEGAPLARRSAAETISGIWTHSAELKVNVGANSPSVVSIGEPSTLRGDSQDSALFLYGEHAGAINSFVFSNSGANLSISSSNAAASIQFSVVLDVLSGKALRVRDAANTDWVDFSHDGTNFNLVGTNTTDINISGVTNVDLSADNLKLRLGVGNDLALYHDGTNSKIANATGTLDITSAGTVTVDKPFRLKGYTVATLPAGTQGDTAFVTDALAPAFGAAVVGGGAGVVPVFYDGTNWIVG